MHKWEVKKMMVNIWTFNAKLQEQEMIETINTETITSIEIDGNKRIFKMSGMGRLVEEIIECNDQQMELSYSAVETMAPINHHLANIKLTSKGNDTLFTWTTEIDPPEFADAIREGMLTSLEELEKVLKK